MWLPLSSLVCRAVGGWGFQGWEGPGVSPAETVCARLRSRVPGRLLPPLPASSSPGPLRPPPEWLPHALRGLSSLSLLSFAFPLSFPFRACLSLFGFGVCPTHVALIEFARPRAARRAHWPQLTVTRPSRGSVPMLPCLLLFLSGLQSLEGRGHWTCGWRGSRVTISSHRRPGKHLRGRIA